MRYTNQCLSLCVQIGAPFGEHGHGAWRWEQCHAVAGVREQHRDRFYCQHESLVRAMVLCSVEMLLNPLLLLYNQSRAM